MALKRIQDLDAAATLDGTELVELEQAGGSVQCTAQDIANLAVGTGGDVTGPASSTDGNFALFDGVTGKLLEDGGAPGEMAFIDDAPIDGDEYVRKDGAWAVATGGGGSGTPGGSDKQVQYNNSGAFGGEATFEYDDSTNTLTVSNITTAGLLLTAASAAGGAGFRLPHGAAPTSPTNGDVWTTTAGMYVRVNGATVGPLSASGSGTDRSTVTALSISSGVVNIDCSLGDYFTLSLTANVTSITFSNLPASGKGASIAVQIRQDGTGSRTVTLPSSFKATGGSDTAVQSAANAYTLLTLTTFDQGTRWAYAMQEVAP